MTNYMDEYRRWCEDSYFDDNTRQELKALTSEEAVSYTHLDVYKRQPPG